MINSFRFLKSRGALGNLKFIGNMFSDINKFFNSIFIMKFSNLRKAGLMRWLGGVGAVCLLAATFNPVFAEETTVHLNVDLRNGGTDTFLLSEKPEITFSGTSCVIICSNINATYDMADITRAYFTEKSSGLNERQGEGVSIDLTDPSTALISGLTPGAPVTLYGIDGTLILTATADGEGFARVPLDNLASDTVYVVSINSTKNIKLYKK